MDAAEVQPQIDFQRASCQQANLRMETGANVVKMDYCGIIQ